MIISVVLEYFNVKVYFFGSIDISRPRKMSKCPGALVHFKVFIRSGKGKWVSIRKAWVWVRYRLYQLYSDLTKSLNYCFSDWGKPKGLRHYKFQANILDYKFFSFIEAGLDFFVFRLPYVLHLL